MPASGDARKSWGATRVAQHLGINYPIIQAPFGGLRSQPLTATVSNSGGLGSMGAVTFRSSAISEVIAEVRSLTSKRFAISLGRTAQRQRAHRDVAVAGVGRGGFVAEERWGPAATGSTARGRKTRPCKRAGRFRRTLSAHTIQMWRWPDAHELQPG